MTSSSDESEIQSSRCNEESDSDEEASANNSSESSSSLSDQRSMKVKKPRRKRTAGRRIVESDEDDVSHEESEKVTKSQRKTVASSDADDAVSSNEEIKSKKRKQRKMSRKTASESKKQKKPAGRREIRTVLKKGQLTEETKDAEKQERERRKRLQKSKDSKIVEVDIDQSFDAAVPLPITKRLVLQKEPLVEVHPHITRYLKPHQVEGIQFIWDNLIETTAEASKGVGGGCILAHCMGLGKTLQTISVVHTLLTSEHLSFNTALVVAPLNTLLNWINEFTRWVPEDLALTLYNLNEYQTIRDRLHALKEWHKTGGVMVLGYDMFRLLASGVRIRYKKWKIEFAELLLDPGPDVVVCDEGHKLKNSESNTSVVMNKIKTSRRLVLTGTPLQNNLMEYQCMVNFVKPNLLGSVKEFRNRFVNPIQNGQHSDSTPLDVRLMKKRCHVLHNMLQGFVQRKDYTALSKYLCEKLEFIVKVRLTPLQIQLYRLYLDTQTNRGSNPYAVVYGSRDTGLFADYQNLMRVWTHPRVLRLHTVKQENMNFLNDDSSEEYEASSDEEGNGDDNKEKNEAPVNGIAASLCKDEEKNTTNSKKQTLNSSDESCDSESESEEEESSFDGSAWEKEGDGDEEPVVKVKRVRRGGRYRLRGGDSDEEQGAGGEEQEELTKEIDDNSWYSKLYNENSDQFENIESGGKLAVLFEILFLARQCDDKVLVFSQSLLSLDLIEEMLQLSTAKALSIEAESAGLEEGVYQKWYKNVDYFRIDGSSLSKSRQRWIDEFNSDEDRRARLFLISTKAGSLGVNLVAANRVVIFDASWNPTHDVQSIFRVYRFGQTKSCFIYRLIAQGTMEEKIYDRQVTKQSLSFRVVDEQQINRYFTAHDLQELYNFTPAELGEEKPIHTLPKDKLLAELLVGSRTRNLIASYHKHDSLLDHQEEEELTEEERKAAWEEYEKEKAGIPQRPPPQPRSALVSSSDILKGARMQFYQQQILAQQQLLKIKREELMRKSNSSAVERKREVLFAQLLQVSDRIVEVKKRAELSLPLNVEQAVAAMRQVPMYANMREESLRLIALEVRLRRQQAQLEAEKELKTLQQHMKLLNAEYQKLVAESEYVASTAASLEPAANSSTVSSSLMQSIRNQSLEMPVNSSLTRAGLIARSAFADMLKNHLHPSNASTAMNTSSTPINMASAGVNAASTGVNATSTAISTASTGVNSATTAVNAVSKEACSSNSTSDPVDVDLDSTSNRFSSVDTKSASDPGNEVQLKAAVVSSKPGTSKTVVGSKMELSVSLTKLPSDISSSLSNPSVSGSKNSFNFTVEAKSDRKSTPQDKEPKVLLKSVKQSISHTKRKKAQKQESSDEEFVLTDEEDDWEQVYLKKAKASSRRTRN